MNMYGYRTTAASSGMSGAEVWGIIALVLALVGGIVLYFTFLSKQNEGKFKGFLGWLYDFLSFKNMLLDAILRITYLIMAIFITLDSFSLIGTNFLLFIVVLVLGNLIIRIIYEFSLILLTICRNTSEINKKLKK